jgi:serine/threonine protein kinase
VESTEERLTIQQEGRVLGTANYCAPEQAIDSHRVDSRADLYSLGCTLYFLLAGRPPFHEGSLTQRLLAHQNLQPARIEDLRSDVPAELGALLRRMMAKSPAQRIATAREVAEALDEMGDADGRLRIRKPEKQVVPPPVLPETQQKPRFVVDPLSELREAIGKVNSVERAVAMLKAELPAARVEGPLRNSRLPDLRKERAARRQSSARRLISGVTLSLAILMSTLATWSPPPARPGRPRSVAALEPNSSGATRQPPFDVSSPKPRAIVAQGLDGLRAGL